MSRKNEFNTKYSPEFKIAVIMDMRENHLSYSDTVRRYWGVRTKTDCSKHRSQVRLWERIYLEEGAAGLMTERRGRKSTGRPRKKPLDKEIENDLIAENQRLKERNEYLEMEIEYLKKLDALVQAREQQNAKKRK
jgi:transposase-like protein